MKESSEKSYTELKREYIISQMRYWLLNKKIKESCPAKHVSVLYFYSNEECDDCGPQGTILSYLKEKLKDRLLIFSLDADFVDEPMINILKETYNITETPSIVIEEEVFNNLVNKEDITKKICSYYDKKPMLCLDD